MKKILSVICICVLMLLVAGCVKKSVEWEHEDIMTYEQYVKLNNLSVELTPQIVELLDIAMNNSAGLSEETFMRVDYCSRNVYSLNDSLRDINSFRNADVERLIENYEQMKKELPALKKAAGNK